MSKLCEKIHPLLTQQIINILSTKQIITIDNFLDHNSQTLVNITRLKFKDILTIKKAIIKQYSARRLNGYQYYQDTLKNCAIIPTGIPRYSKKSDNLLKLLRICFDISVDQLLDGGLFTGNIYEICGLPASGKTQFVLTIVMNIITNLQKQIYFIDTKNNLISIKLHALLQKTRNASIVDNLKRVLVFNTITRYELFDVLQRINDLKEKKSTLRLIIIDSLPTVLLNINDQIENNIYLNRLVKLMRQITVEYHVAILVINLINSWNDETLSQPRIMCGKYWKSIPNTRLLIEKGQFNEIQLTVAESDLLNVNKNCTLSITDEGIK